MNLIFDLNYILHKNVGMLHKTNDLYGFLYQKLTDNIDKWQRMNKWDNVYIVSDSKSKSWRKDFLDDYKGKRKRTEDINWEWVFTEYDTWKNDMQESGKYNIFERKRVEGDDWITALVLKTNSKWESNCIISSDRDLKQLLRYKIKDDNKHFINIQINDKSGDELLYLPVGWNIWFDHADKSGNTDLFNLDNSWDTNQFFKRISTTFRTQEVDKYWSLLHKIVHGDSGDNIKSVFEKLTTTGKVRGIGEKTADKICDFYFENYATSFSTTDETFITDVINCIEKILKIEFTNKQLKTVKSKIEKNIFLMELHYRHYPEDILELVTDELKNKM